MTEKENTSLHTFQTVSDLCKIGDYRYQAGLTPKLDVLEGDFNQNIINEIVLWKVNRHTLIAPETLVLLNKIKKLVVFMPFLQTIHHLLQRVTLRIR